MKFYLKPWNQMRSYREIGGKGDEKGREAKEREGKGRKLRFTPEALPLF